MSKAIATTKSTDLSTDVESWDDQVEGGAEELIIGKVLMQQGLSDRVSDGLAKLGDYVNTLSGEVVGGFDKELDLIPFMFTRRYVVSEKKPGSSRFTFKRFDTITKANEKAPWFFDENGVEMKREYLREFYCIDPNDTTLPVIIGFKSTSAQVGKQIWMQMYHMNKAAGKVPPAYHITIGSKKESKDGAAYAVSTYKRGNESTNEEITICRQWMNTLKTQDIRVDDSDIDGTTVTDSPSNF